MQATLCTFVHFMDNTVSIMLTGLENKTIKPNHKKFKSSNAPSILTYAFFSNIRYLANIVLVEVPVISMVWLCQNR